MLGARAGFVVALLAALLPSMGCGAPRPPPASVEQAFHLDPLTDLVALPRLAWLIDAKPRALYALPGLAVALEELVGSERLSAFGKAHGGLDPRGLREVAYARFESSPGHSPGELWLGRGYVPVEAVEAAELRAFPYVRQHAREPSGLIRIEARADNEAIDVLLFGHQGIARGIAASVPAKAARAFAEKRLKKVRPALSTGPLAELERALGPADVRAFAARPDRAFARDGLFEHFEALGLAVLPSEQGGVLFFTLRVVGVGSFADRESVVEAEVARRLARIDGSRVGALLGMTQAPPWALRTDSRTVIAERRVQGAPFLHGLHLATGADTTELFATP